MAEHRVRRPWRKPPELRRGHRQHLRRIAAGEREGGAGELVPAGVPGRGAVVDPRAGVAAQRGLSERDEVGGEARLRTG